MENGLYALLDVTEEPNPEHVHVTILLRRTEEQSALEMLQKAENVTLSLVHLLQVSLSDTVDDFFPSCLIPYYKCLHILFKFI